MSDELKRLRELAAKLPDGLRADWLGTNHFELTTDVPEHGYWWLEAGDLQFAFGGEDAEHPDERPCSDTKAKFGLLLDIAEEVSRLKPWLKGQGDE